MDRSRPVFAWAMYDFANSAYVTTVATALLPAYFAAVVAPDGLSLGAATIPAVSLWGYAVSFAAALVFVLAPVLGAVADRGDLRGRFLMLSCLAGSLATVLVSFGGQGDIFYVLGLFVCAHAAFNAGNTFYDAFLPDVAPPGQRDRVSSLGYAFGYAGGGLQLALALGLVQGHGLLGLDKSQAVRLGMALAGVWWLGFALISFRGLAGLPARRGAAGRGAGTAAHATAAGAGATSAKPASVAAEAAGDAAAAGVSGSAGALEVDGSAGAREGAGAADLAEGWPARILQGARDAWGAARRIAARPDAFRFLLAYIFYNDGVQTVISMATIYGKQELGLSEGVLILTLLGIQAVALAGAFLFARLAGRFGAKRALMLSLVLWTGVVVYGFSITSAAQYMIMGVAVGLVLGGSQALSRSVYSRLVPPGEEAVHFGFFSVLTKLSAVLGPLVFALVSQATGSARPAVLALVLFFLIGLVLLARVKVDGER